MNQEINQIPNKPAKKKLNIMPILTILAIIYFGFLLYQAVYVNYHTNKKIEEYSSSLAQNNDEQENLKHLIAYYQTETFQELEARKKLGLKMPGEKVVKVDVPEANKTPEPKKTISKEQSQQSNPELWSEFLFGQ